MPFAVDAICIKHSDRTIIACDEYFGWKPGAHSLEIVDLVVQKLADVPRQIVVPVDKGHRVQQLIGHVQSLLERCTCARGRHGER